ncbi:Holliday junction branch migration protein RuvA [Caproiciproducens sp. NJN-50]|uniref:Holliday junction branch migration protein RuvA n=1 Tax=Acutalibacteraceae TaxID=3082771 RepID=UPI000FFE1D27|nr:MULTISPECIES: Holliday junction branch migration protein RuvA [Acutalibacteraceae]QAT50571.1 Holliday junction branch migration protein RuvA [Caproiciproducens sp. NJN-50]
MIYSVKGTLTHMEPGIAVVECGGVGFKCFTSLNTQRALPQIGAQAKLFTVLNVREDALDLFGFSTQAELSCFKMLTGVSGVGPKAGLAILSELKPEQVAASVATGDSKTLTRASGVGPKLAQRICLELRDRVRDLGGTEGTITSAAGAVSASSHAAAAVEALSVLGYSPSDASAIVAQFDSALPVEELIRLSLRTIDAGKQGG